MKFDITNECAAAMKKVSEFHLVNEKQLFWCLVVEKVTGICWAVKLYVNPYRSCAVVYMSISVSYLR